MTRLTTCVAIISLPLMTLAQVTCPTSGVTADSNCYFLSSTSVSIGFFGNQECQTQNARLAFVNTQAKHDAVVAMFQSDSSLTSSSLVLVGAFRRTDAPNNNISDFDWLCTQNLNVLIPVTQGYTAQFGDMTSFECSSYNVGTSLINAENCIGTFSVLCEIVTSDICVVTTTTPTTTPTTTTPTTTTPTTTTATTTTPTTTTPTTTTATTTTPTTTATITTTTVTTTTTPTTVTTAQATTIVATPVVAQAQARTGCLTATLTTIFIAMLIFLMV